MNITPIEQYMERMEKLADTVPSAKELSDALLLFGRSLLEEEKRFIAACIKEAKHIHDTSYEEVKDLKHILEEQKIICSSHAKTKLEDSEIPFGNPLLVIDRDSILSAPLADGTQTNLQDLIIKADKYDKMHTSVGCYLSMVKDVNDDDTDDELHAEYERLTDMLLELVNIIQGKKP